MHRIIDILQEIRPEFDFTQSKDFITDGMLDSFDMIELVSTLDQTYKISIEGIKIIPENFSSIEKITRLVKLYTEDSA